ncbi:MAG: transcription termination factor NusA [Paludibacteraceae bacterium]|nr:transcription termination factor NusA [Paludibacteraceae bacterium]
MAKETEVTPNLSELLKEFTEEKGIDQSTLISVLEDSFRSVIAKMFGTDENFTVVVNPKQGDLEIWRDRIVVEDGAVENEQTQVSISEARKVDPECEVGEDVTDAVEFMSFGRRAILNLRQTLASKILDLQKDAIYDKYKDLVGEIVTAEVYQIWKKEILLLDNDHNEILLPKTEQIPSDFYHKGDSVMAVVSSVDNKNNNLKITVSRTSDMFLQRLFEKEIPEVADGIITIKKIARIPGSHAKVAVESLDDRIDPVGSCVGVKGSRIHNIVRELRNENIDIINYTSNIELLIARSLSPAKIVSLKIDEENKRAEVYLQPDNVSLAIGKGGSNIKLACKLTGYTIEVFRYIDGDSMEEDDIYLDEFSDEIEQWVLDTFKEQGYDTARRVLAVSREDLIKQTDLEEETIDNVIAVLKAEFEE